jgi:hypothetical protein
MGQPPVALAAKHQLATVNAAREFVDACGLVSYAVSNSDDFTVAAPPDEIFKGPSPPTFRSGSRPTSRWWSTQDRQCVGPNSPR